MEEYVWISRLIGHSLFVNRDHPALHRLAVEHDVTITIDGPEDYSTEPYLEAFYRAIDRRAAGIMVIGWNDADIVPAIDAAVRQGIPVVTIDSDIPGCRRMAFAGTDWHLLGGSMADDLAVRIGGQGRVLMLGTPRLENNQLGFRGFLNRIAAYPMIEIVGQEDDLDIGPDRAADIVGQYLERFPDLAGIAGFDVNSGPGAARVLSEIREPGEVRLVCVETDTWHRKYLRDGVIDSLFAQKRETFTGLAFQMLYTYNHGSTATGHRPGAVNIAGDVNTGYIVVNRNNIDSITIDLGLDDSRQYHRLYQKLALASGMLENSADLAIAADHEFRLIYANPAAMRHLKIKPEHMGEVSLDNVLGLTDHQRALIRACLEDGKPFTFQTTIGDEGKALIPFLVNGSRLIKNGAVGGVTLSAADISGLEKVKDALRREHDFIEKVVETSPVGITRLDADGQIIFANPKAEKALGLSKEKITSRTYNGPEWRITDFDGNPFPDEALPFQIVKKTGRPVYGVCHAIEGSGGDRALLSINAAPIFNDAGGFDGIVAAIEDVTDRRRSEEQLHLLSSAVQQSMEGIAVADLEGRLQYVNNSFAKMHGYAPEELIGRHLSILHTSAQMPAVETANKQILKEGSFFGEIWHVRRDGTVFATIMNNYLLRNHNGQPVNMVGTMWDVTRRKQVEEELRASEERFRLLSNAAEEGIVIHDAGTIVDANEALARMFGYELPEMIGMNAVQFVSPESWAVVRHNVTSGYDLPYEVTGVKKDGSIICLHLVGKPFRYKDRMLRVTAVRDITGLKKAEEALRQSEEKFRIIFEAAQDAIYIKDRNLAYVAVNPAMARILDSTPDDIIGRTLDDVREPENRFSSRENELKVLKGEIISEESTVLINGQPHTFHGVTVPMRDSSGNIIGLCGIARDVTENRKLRNLADRARRLETAGRIAGEVAHDFNNLLGPLIAYPGLMRDELPENHPVLEYLNDIEKAAEQMADINGQLLTLGRRGHYNMEPININDIIRMAVERARPFPENIAVTTELPGDLMNIMGGVSQIYRVISNLTSNALDAMNSGGRLSIKTENYYVEGELGAYNRIPRGEYVKVTISDTGCGIPPNILPSIFDPFFTTKTADRKRGSGLGLSVVHAVVEDHKGYVDVVSQPGEGTSFYLYFPITRNAAPTPETVSIRGGEESILIVDDDPTQGEVTSRLLQRLGYRVSIVGGGEEAIQYLTANHPDLLALDMAMGRGIDGTETYRRALEINPAQKAILFSGFAESARVREALEMGAGAFLRKPLTLNTLAAAVRKELDRTVKDAAGR